MSGGQRQRVALGRALTRQAGVVLLDEPLSGLDAQLRLALRAEIGTMLRATGATTVHVTHDQADAMAMADRIALVHNGIVEQIGTPEELYRRPASIFVATFIGTPPMTMFNPNDDGDTPFGPLAPTARLVTLGIRPEQVCIGRNSHPWTARARVRLIEHEGASSVLHLDCSGAPLRARIAADTRVEIGGEIVVGCDPVHVHVFDRDNGMRLGSAAAFLEPSRG